MSAIPSPRAALATLRRQAGPMFHPLRARWNIQGRKAAAAGRLDRDPVIRIVGLTGSVIGIGEGARLMDRALRRAGYRMQTVDVSPLFGRREELPGPQSVEGEADVCIAVLNPPELISTALRRPEVLRCPRLIGYWSWELETMPRQWESAFCLVDEIWCQSNFTAQAIRGRAPRGLPVKVVPHPVNELETPPADRRRFDLPDDKVVVLTSFDVNSTLARKNPEAALEAFRLATADAAGRAVLICKVVGWERRPDLFEELASRDDVVLLRETLSDVDMATLISSCDIALSLHRAEGFGLMPARAMMMGKAVVATGWSGNLEFMDPESAALVPYRLVPVSDPQGVYRHGVWAEPDVAEAARLLRSLIVDPARRTRMGEAARRRSRAIFNPEAYNDLIAERLGAPSQSLEHDRAGLRTA